MQDVLLHLHRRLYFIAGDLVIVIATACGDILHILHLGRFVTDSWVKQCEHPPS